jgi:ribonuclease P protein component
MGVFDFPKSERLYLKKSIQQLFARGYSFNLFPFRVSVMKRSDPGRVHQVLISVSKRSFKKAVDRNMIKRRVREAYRLNKGQIQELPKLQIAYIYTADKILDFHQIQEHLIESFKRLREYAEKN